MWVVQLDQSARHVGFDKVRGSHSKDECTSNCAEISNSIIHAPKEVRQQMLSKKQRILYGICFGIGIVAIADVAHAGIYNTNYDVIAPLVQNGVTTAYQTKTYTGHGTTRDAGTGYVSVASVGSTYKTDAQMCSVGGFACGGGIKVRNLDDGSAAYQFNSYAAGTSQMVGQFQISSPNLATVRITGTYRTDGG